MEQAQISNACMSDKIEWIQVWWTTELLWEEFASEFMTIDVDVKGAV